MRLCASASLIPIAGLMLCLQAAAAQPAPPGSGPEVRLEARDGKTRYLLGERIPLELVFRNNTADSYTLNTTCYGDLSEQVEITPARGWTQWQGQSGHDYANVAHLTGQEIRISVLLNDGFVFREPGHYEVRVVTHRLSRGLGLDGKPYPPVTTNSVGIDLEPMPPEEESARVRTLLAILAAADVSTPEGTTAWRDALHQLVALGGDDALRAKIDLILTEDDDVRGVTSQALASTRNLPLQLALLEAAWRDPRRDPIYDMPAALAQTRALMRGHALRGWTQVMSQDNSEEARLEARLEAREHAADMQALLESLPARSGESRADAAFFLVGDRTLTPAQQTTVKPIAIQEFPHMGETEQATLLESAWPALRDPAMLPALRAMLDKSPTDGYALPRLIELDPTGAKPYVIRAVCDGEHPVQLDAVAGLPDATLPEVDACLGALLRVAPAKPTNRLWKTRALLAGRFASAAILPALREGWTDSSQDGPALALLLRYEPAEAVGRLQHAAKFNLFYEIGTVYKARRAPFPPQLRDWLRELVRTGSTEDAATAAYELSGHGLAEDRTVLERRLAEVRAHAAEPGAAALDASLMSSLRMASAWYVDNADKARLASGCLTEACKATGAPMPGDNPFE